MEKLVILFLMIFSHSAFGSLICPEADKVEGSEIYCCLEDKALCEELHSQLPSQFINDVSNGFMTAEQGLLETRTNCFWTADQLAKGYQSSEKQFVLSPAELSRTIKSDYFWIPWFLATTGDIVVFQAVGTGKFKNERGLFEDFPINSPNHAAYILRPGYVVQKDDSSSTGYAISTIDQAFETYDALKHEAQFRTDTKLFRRYYRYKGNL